MPTASSGSRAAHPDRPDRPGPGDAFSAAAALTSEAYWRVDTDTGPLRATGGWRKILGHDPTGGHWLEQFHADDHRRLEQAVHDLRDRRTRPATVEVRAPHTDGTWRWLRLCIALEDDERPAGPIVGTALDVSDHHRTQDLFERIVRHNALILNAAGDGIYCIDRDGQATFVNPAAARHLGTSVSALTGTPLCSFLSECTVHAGHPEHAASCPIDATLRTGLPHRVYDARFVRADGVSFPAEYTVSPIRERGKVSGAVVVFNDVSERRWSEEEIRRERRFSDGLIKSSLDGILAYDKDLVFTIWNPAMERITGIVADRVIGRPVEEVFGHVRDTDEMANVRATLRGRTVVVADRPFHVPETGRSGFFEARYAPLYDDRLEILGGLGIVHDTTEEKRREEEVKASRDKLVRAEKLAALGTLVSGVGHELRTPMSYINNHLYLLKMLAKRMKHEDPDAAPVADEILKRSESSMDGIKRMAALLDDLRATYRRDDADLKRSDLRPVVDEALRLFAGAYEGPVHLHKDLESTGDMFIEAGRFQQVVINLLNNAAEAMPDGGDVTVRLRPCGGGVELLVSDTGTGMTSEVQGSIFNPFYTTKKDGSGLGLYLVKQIVERHMGRIECTSVLGAGTTFRIFLPRREPVGVAEDEEGSEKGGDEVAASIDVAAVRRGRRGAGPS